MPRPEDHAISLNSPPRDAEVGGWASRDRRGPARADDARRQPLGRKKAGNQDLESPYFPLSNQRSPRDPHACTPTATSKGVTLRRSAGLAWRPRGRDPTPGDWNPRSKVNQVNTSMEDELPRPPWTTGRHASSRASQLSQNAAVQKSLKDYSCQMRFPREVIRGCSNRPPVSVRRV